MEFILTMLIMAKTHNTIVYPPFKTKEQCYEFAFMQKAELLKLPTDHRVQTISFTCVELPKEPSLKEKK